jgi:4-hydroxythreonine-4-phosphate dehydrogenase
MHPRPVIGLTLGDPAGIGPELCLRALADRSLAEQFQLVVFGDVAVLEAVARELPVATCGRDGELTLAGCAVISPADVHAGLPTDRPVIVDCQAIRPGEVKPGRISAACGRAGYAYIEQAIAAAQAGRIHGVATAPIHKEALRAAGVPHPGHTEIFTALTGARRSCMMLYSEVITVSMVTTHIGYHEVPAKLNAPRILDVIELTAGAMSRLAGRPPRLGVCGLNPHAGEHGLFGRREEEEVVQPAIEEARRRGYDVVGPLVPDAAFTPHGRQTVDAFVCLYHDQGHIPFKMLAFDTGVNTTLGLPMIRTSVDHGTAFDIAWQGRAQPTSLFAAIRVAARLAGTGGDR